MYTFSALYLTLTLYLQLRREPRRVHPLEHLADTRSRLRRCQRMCIERLADAMMVRDSHHFNRQWMPADIVTVTDALLARHEQQLKNLHEATLVADKLTRGLIVPYTADAVAADQNVDLYNLRQYAARVPADIESRLDALDLNLFHALTSYAS